jgi:hypothetical protein
VEQNTGLNKIGFSSHNTNWVFKTTNTLIKKFQNLNRKLQAKSGDTIRPTLKPVVNLSKHPLQENIVKVLERGLNFAIVSNKVPTEAIIRNVETGLQKEQITKKQYLKRRKGRTDRIEEKQGSCCTKK